MLLPYVYSSFLGRGCLGNTHRLYLNQDLSSARLISLSNEVAPHILIALTPEHPSALTREQLRFFHNGHEVFFCGSGLAALAHYFFVDKKSAEETSKRVVITTGDIELQLEKRGALFGFSTAKHFLFEDTIASAITNKCVTNTSKKVEAALGCTVRKLTYVEDNYLIAELETERSVKALQPNFESFAELTQALIVTAPSKQENSYAMRYFAPQFGNPEDAATGSANLILTQYWHKQNDADHWTGHQLSATGGLFFGEVCSTTNRTALLGYATVAHADTHTHDQQIGKRTG